MARLFFSLLVLSAGAVVADEACAAVELLYPFDGDVLALSQPIDGEAGYALCYRVLLRLATSPYVREVTDLKDYVRAPKANGYRSLHATIVPTSSRLPRFEIQVRTRAMDDVGTIVAWSDR